MSSSVEGGELSVYLFAVFPSVSGVHGDHYIPLSWRLRKAPYVYDNDIMKI
jgi:hypothetical protein